MRRLPALLAVGSSVLLLVACAGSRSGGKRQVTVGKYGSYGVDTISAPGHGGRGEVCRSAAESFAAAAHTFVIRFGSTAASSTDVYYMELREQLADFDVHGCQRGLLFEALVGTLTAKQRRALVAELPQTLAHQVRKSLTASR
jgi:hypothetical protein